MLSLPLPRDENHCYTEVRALRRVREARGAVVRRGRREPTLGALAGTPRRGREQYVERMFSFCFLSMQGHYYILILAVNVLAAEFLLLVVFWVLSTVYWYFFYGVLVKF